MFSGLAKGFGLVIAAVIAGCSTKYQPQLVLPPAPVLQLIDASVELHPLLATDELRSGHATYGVLADDYVNKPPSKLTKAITSEILDELSTSGVFRQVTTYDPHPDLILTGLIERFYEHDRRKIWTYVPYYSDKLAGLFRLNTYMSTGEVNMTMMLLKPTGEMIGTYTGLVRFDEDFTPNDEMQPGDRLNRAFSQALGQIRDDMLADIKLPKARLTEPVVQRHRSDGNF
ncbi:MAG: hypothetical protein ACREIM_03945 [Nitrospiraceae bacterium]